jgi:hypothetical protein
MKNLVAKRVTTPICFAVAKVIYENANSIKKTEFNYLSINYSQKMY